MEKRHILLICPDGQDFNLVKHTGTLAIALCQMGYRISVCVGGVVTTPLENLKNQGVKVYCVCVKKRFFIKAAGPLGHVLEVMLFARKLRAIIRQDPTIDIAHFTDLRPPFGLLVKEPYLLQMPIVGEIHRKVDLAVKSFPFWGGRKHLKGLKMVQPLVVSSNALLECAHTHTDLGPVAYIPLGVPVDRFKPALSKKPARRAVGLPEKGVLVCCMADITAQNAQLELLEKCFPLSAQRHVVLIGQVLDEGYLTKIMARAAEKGMSAYVHVRDAKHMPEAYLKACDVFMLLGGVEARHATILEAQSAGLPVVLGPSESSLMLCNGNRSGVVLLANNSLARASFQKILEDPSYRQGKALNARPFVVKYFSFREMMAAYDRLYQSL